MAVKNTVFRKLTKWRVINLRTLTERHTITFRKQLINLLYQPAWAILVNLGENIAKLRICAHNLEIEKGRYFQINRTEIFCKICNDLEIEDENHFLWQCEKYRKEREILFKKVSFYYKKFPNFHNETIKSKLLLNSKSVRINKLCTDFISNLLKIRKDSIS